jgi:integrase
MDNGVLTVRASQRKMAGRFVINAPKTRAGSRTLALNQVAIAALRAHRAQLASERLQLGAAWADATLVFPNEAGERMAASTFYRGRFLPLLQRAGLPAIRFHDLRHTFGTLLLLLGIDRKIVSEMLGHASVTITQNLYQHVSAEMQRDASASLERLLFGNANNEH